MLLPDPEEEHEAVDDGDGDHEVPDGLLAVVDVVPVIVFPVFVSPGHLEDDVGSVLPDQIHDEEIADCNRGC